MTHKDQFRAPSHMLIYGAPLSMRFTTILGYKSTGLSMQIYFQISALGLQGLNLIYFLSLSNRVILENSSVSIFIGLLNQYVQSDTQQQVHKTVHNFYICCCFSSNVYLRESTCLNTYFVRTGYTERYQQSQLKQAQASQYKDIKHGIIKFSIH